MPTETLVPGNLPLRIRRGIGFGPITFNFKNALGAAFDLTGYTAEFTARPEENSPNKLNLTASVEAPATGGQVKLAEMTDEQVAVALRPFPDGEMPYDLVLINVSGNKLEPPVSGILTIDSTEGGTQ